ncbi:HEAT repeat-containing protein 6-like isoform X2 [Homarus americanus]|uniref:HEAT repeat-containing protein 6-like isoform X2 n=1 Tax=Homarus americanus TaxID=6706 RepID=UPI001C437B95|nr:HEAT repeat-containing protein 6-like isoform X2 [Homarus americanus]
MASQKTQGKWSDLVTLLLRVQEAPRSPGEEVSLATTLSELSQCSAKLRVVYDHRQIHSLVEHCVSGIVSPKSALVRQTSQLLASLLRRQGSTSLPSLILDKIIAWLSSALHYHERDVDGWQTVHQILRALADALRDAPDHAEEIYLSLAGSKGSLIYTLESGSSCRNRALAMQCLHLLTYVTPEVVAEARQHNEEIFPAAVVSSIQRIVIYVLKQPLPSPDVCSHKLYLHLVASALSVLYNLVVCAPNDVLGNIIVSACRPFVFYGLPGFAHNELVKHTTSPEVDIPLSSGMDSDSSSRNYTNRNRRKRLRRKRAQPSRSTSDCEGRPCPLVAAVDGLGLGLRGPPPATALASVSLKPQWARGKQIHNKEEETINISASALEAEHSPELFSQDESFVEARVSGSETDFSDFDGGGEKETTLMARTRQCSLQAINAVIDSKKVGKQHKFSYWPPLMCQTPSLMTSVLKDPSPSVRMASLQVINTFLLDSSQVLTLAVENEGKSSYTTLGHQLGTSLRELHRCLALALLSEKFPGALVRTLKTIELLVENVNYSNLKPGLLTKLVTHVKYFMRYKEAVVRANAFSVMVSVLMIKPQVAELQHLLIRFQTPAPPTLTCPPEVLPPPVMEEELPGQEEDEAETNLKSEMEKMNLLSEDEEEKTEDNAQDKSMVSWLIQRCVDSLLTPDHEAVRGIFIQVQLQSLKVLSALVSEHLNIIHQSLPLIQHVITVCSEAVREPFHPKMTDLAPDSHKKFEAGEGFDPAFMSPDPGVVVEHAYILLGSLLGAVKADLDKGANSCVSVSQVQQLWLWVLQGPLQILFKQAAAEQSRGSMEKGGAPAVDPPKQDVNWRNRDALLLESLEDRLKQTVAIATVLTHFSPSIFESLGEECITLIIKTVKWLVTHEDPDLRLAGARIMAIIVSFPGVVGNSGGVSLLQATVMTTCDLLTQRENNVNRYRLLASWALANVSSVFELYVDSWKCQEHGSGNEILSPMLIVQLLEVGIRACKDKDKIKPHGVRCVGNITSFLRAEQAADPTIAPLVSKAIDTLVLCSSTGSNMKTRWNACRALGNILSSGRLPIADMPWRSQVLTTLGNLVESFKNYKVRIQACSAICSLRSREEFGSEYYGIWRVLLHGLDNAQNIIDYQEIRHRDELINQICEGICQLSTHLTLEDAGSLCELLQLHQDMATPLLKKAYLSLPPERTGHALKAQSRVEELLSYDALTESQQLALIILNSLTAAPTTTNFT